MGQLVAGPRKQCVHELLGSTIIPKASAVFWQPSDEELTTGQHQSHFHAREAHARCSIRTTVCVCCSMDSRNPL